MFHHDDTPIASREELSRQAVHDYYASPEGGEREDAFTLLLLIRASATTSMSMRDLLETRGHYRRAPDPQAREKIRTRVMSTMIKTQRQGLVTKQGTHWAISDRGRQFVIAGIHSRASTYRLGTCTIDQVCDLCAQDELPGCPVQKDDTGWPTTIAVNLAHYVAGWVRSGETATKQTGGGAMAVTF